MHAPVHSISKDSQFSERNASEYLPKESAVVRGIPILCAVAGLGLATYGAIQFTHLHRAQEQLLQKRDLFSSAETLLLETQVGLLHLERDIRAGSWRETHQENLAATARMADALTTLSTLEDSSLPGAAKLAAEALELWTPLASGASKTAASGRPTSAAAGELADAVRVRAPAVMGLLREAGTRLEGRIRLNASRLPTAAYLPVIIAALLLAAAPILYLRRRLASKTHELQQACLQKAGRELEVERLRQSLVDESAEKDALLDSCQEGLFLIEQDGRISERHSKALRALLREDQLAGRALNEILRPYLPERMQRTVGDYIGLLFDSRRKERQLLRINPLDEVELHYPRKEGGFESRRLAFRFRRILDKGRVSRVFATVIDRTAEFEADARARAAEQRRDRQMALLQELISADANLVGDFLKLLDGELEAIGASFKSQTPPDAASLRPVLQSTHNLKGNALVLGLHSVAAPMEEFERRIQSLAEKQSPTPEDYIPVVLLLGNLRSDLNDILGLRDKLALIQPRKPMVEDLLEPASEAAPSASSALVVGLQQMTAELAKEAGLQVDLSVDEQALDEFSQGRQALVRDVLIQLVRNSIAHGIESPAERVAAGKPPEGTLSITEAPGVAEGMTGILFRDDGRGLGFDRIRELAAQRGLVSAGSAVTDEEAALLIFEPGFTTAGEASSNSGRGIGLDLVRTRIVDESQGQLSVESQAGAYCAFHLHLPTAKGAA